MKVFRIKKELADKKQIETCARQFGVIGDQTRLKICYLLCHYPELSVSEISELVGTSVSAVSHSLSRLRQISLVKSRRQARNIYYSLHDSSFAKVVKSYLKTL